MTDVFDYFDFVFPAAAVHRLVAGVGRARHLALSRPPDCFQHHARAVVATPADLVRLFLFLAQRDRDPLRALAAPWTTLHLGWATLREEPLLPTRSLVLHETAFEIALDLDLPLVERAYPELPVRRGLLCHCAAPASTSSCCKACWLLVRLARRAVAYLTSDSAWGPPLWVFSGGKGAHCFFGSARARATSLEQRRALSASLRADAPVSDAFAVELLRAWEELGVAGADVLARDEACAVLADAYLAGDARTHGVFLNAVRMSPGQGALRWRAFKRLAGPRAVRDLTCKLGRPLVDAGPLCNRNTQVKCPFSLHHKTRCVALPLDDAAFEQFDPATAPSLALGRDALTHRLQGAVAHLTHWLDTNAYVTGNA